MLVGFLALAGLAAAAAWLYPAIRFIRLTQKGVYSPSSRFAAGPQIDVPEAGIAIRLYGNPAVCSSTLVLLPGLHPNGVHDPRYQAFAQTCARAGFLIVAPDIQAFREFRIETETVDQLLCLIEALPAHLPAGSLKNLGLFGVSYAAGIAFLIAARKPEKINFLVSVGGYCDLSRAIDFGLTGFQPERKQIASQPPQEWIRMIFAFNFAEKLTPPRDGDLLREILLLRLNLKEDKAGEKEAGLSQEGKHFLNLIMNGIPENEFERFRAILRERADFFRNLSPEPVLSNFGEHLRIILLHGRNDDLIPYEETMELSRRLSGHAHVHSCITSSLTHVDAKGAEDLLGAFRLFLWVRTLLREVNQPYNICNLTASMKKFRSFPGGNP